MINTVNFLRHFCKIIFLCIISSCINESINSDERLQFALDFAKHNRSELEKVLAFYNNDTLKFKAARFLIENMPLYFSYIGIELDSIKKDLISIESDGAAPEEMKDKWRYVVPVGIK